MGAAIDLYWEPPRVSVGERMKKARKALGHRLRRKITQVELAETLQVGQQTISEWESGEPPPARIAEIAAALDVSEAYLLGREENPYAEALTAHMAYITSRADVQRWQEEVAADLSLDRAVADALQRFADFADPDDPDLVVFQRPEDVCPDLEPEAAAEVVERAAASYYVRRKENLGPWVFRLRFPG